MEIHANTKQTQCQATKYNKGDNHQITKQTLETTQTKKDPMENKPKKQKQKETPNNNKQANSGNASKLKKDPIGNTNNTKEINTK